MNRAERLFVWGGGAVFVASLAVCAWAFAFVWVQSPPFDSQSWRAITVNGVLVTLFAAHHSIFARDSAKTALSRVIPDRLLRSVYVWVAALLLIAVVLLWQPVGGRLYDVDPPFSYVFALVQLGGIALIAGAVRAIDPLELAGIRPPRTNQSLSMHGPYGLVRHPLYLGWLLIVFGSAHMTGDRLTFAVLTTLYLVVAVPWEERSLTRAFGEEYRRYAQQVRWRMIPFVY